MKKFGVLVAIFSAATKLVAAPVGNTSAPDILHKGIFSSSSNGLNFRLGYEGDFVTDGRMEQYNQGEGRVDHYKQWTNSCTLTLNISERMDIYSELGSSKLRADWRFEQSSLGTIDRIKLETEYNFLWAVGSRVILIEWCQASLGCGGRYTSCDYKPFMLSSNGTDTDTANSHCNYREWQINADLSYKIHLFTPYLGVKYNKARTELSDFATPISSSSTGNNSFENRLSVGFYIGCGLSTGNYFMINLEARLVDEEAVTVSSDFRF